MRTTVFLPSLLLTLALPLFTSTAQAQTSHPPPPPSAGSNWERVRVLPINTPIYLTTKKTISCKLQAVDAESLTCTHGTFQRTDIKAVKLPRRTLSTLLATGVGAGTGAIIGFAVGTNGTESSFFGKN